MKRLLLNIVFLLTTLTAVFGQKTHHEIDPSTPFVGVYYQRVFPPFDALLNLDYPYGCLVTKVVPCSAAERHKLQFDDYIIAVDGHQMSEFIDLRPYIKQHFKPGDSVNITYIRNDRMYTEKIKLGSVADTCGTPAFTLKLDTAADNHLADSLLLAEINKRDVVVKEEIHTMRGEVLLKCWDHQRHDGDTIILILNDTILLDSFHLTKEGYTMPLPLIQGKNTLKLIAVNLGSIPPNTAAFNINDGLLNKTVILRSDMGKTEAVDIYYESEE